MDASSVPSDATREARCRRLLRRDGLLVRKSRARLIGSPDYGLYMVVDFDNISMSRGYTLALEDLEDWADQSTDTLTSHGTIKAVDR